MKGHPAGGDENTPAHVGAQACSLADRLTTLRHALGFAQKTGNTARERALITKIAELEADEERAP